MPSNQSVALSLIAEASAVRGEWNVLAIAAQPKTGSSSLRVLINALAPAYRNAQNKSGGEENNPVQCNTLKAETDAMAAAEATRRTGGFRMLKSTGRVLSAMLLREPTARFLSGAAEVFAQHCNGWLQFRRDERRYAKGVRRSSSAGYNLPPRAGAVVTHAGVQQKILARVKFKKSRECAVVGGGRATVLAWNEPLALDELLRTLVADLAAGYRDKHVTQQTYTVFAQPYPGALISIDSQSEWSNFFLKRRHQAQEHDLDMTVQQQCCPVAGCTPTAASVARSRLLRRRELSRCLIAPLTSAHGSCIAPCTPSGRLRDVCLGYRMRFRGGAEQCLCRLVLPHRHLSTRITALLFVHLILIFYLILYLFGLRDRYAYGYAREKCKIDRALAAAKRSAA